MYKNKGDIEVLYHGSTNGSIDVLRPRQAYRFNDNVGEMIPDGEPGVFATQMYDIAVFRALINREGVVGASRSSFNYEKGVLTFKATKNVMQAAKMKRGYVYVLPSKLFVKVDEIQWKAMSEIVPIEVLEVGYDDLPRGIEEISE